MTNRLPVVGDVVRWKHWASSHGRWAEEGHVVTKVKPYEEPYTYTACYIYVENDSVDSYGWTYTLEGGNFELLDRTPQVGDVLEWRWGGTSFIGEQTITKILPSGRVMLSPGHRIVPEDDWHHDPKNQFNNWTVVKTVNAKEQERKALEEQRKRNLELLQEKLAELDLLVGEIQELRVKL